MLMSTSRSIKPAGVSDARPAKSIFRGPACGGGKCRSIRAWVTCQTVTASARAICRKAEVLGLCLHRHDCVARGASTPSLAEGQSVRNKPGRRKTASLESFFVKRRRITGRHGDGARSCRMKTKTTATTTTDKPRFTPKLAEN